MHQGFLPICLEVPSQKMSDQIREILNCARGEIHGLILSPLQSLESDRIVSYFFLNG